MSENFIAQITLNKVYEKGGASICFCSSKYKPYLHTCCLPLPPRLHGNRLFINDWPCSAPTCTPSITDQQRWWSQSNSVLFFPPQQFYSIQRLNASCQSNKRVCFGYLNINQSWQAGRLVFLLLFAVITANSPLVSAKFPQHLWEVVMSSVSAADMAAFVPTH